MSRTRESLRSFLVLVFNAYAIDRTGIWMLYYGDEVAWIWPWRRNPHTKDRWLSLLATWNGDFSDATFRTLKDLLDFWDIYDKESKDG